MTRRIIWIVLAWLVFSCNKENSEPVFRLLESKDTGLDFVNKLTPTKDLNIFNYLYYYNGAGSGAGDLNNDGLIDLVFSGNQVDNKLYLNKGNLKFEDITIKSGFSAKKGWSTGVSLVDINQDGLLDIYICRVGDFLGLKGHNLLFVCKNIDKNGLPHYTEESAKYGLNLVGFGTQASFFDYDADGDLDFFLLTHSVHQNNTYNQRSIFLDTFHPLAGDRFLKILMENT
ncbi:MAG: VCBS repeat-containing protein [Cytophagaceae bacterium]|nr:VCBS repeat-containing protein [Cytophagaceae bacterium]